MTRGSFVHKATELYDRGELDFDSLDDALRPYLDGWIQFRQDYGFVPTEIEKSYISEAYNFGCRVDRIGLYRGEPALVEIKSGTMLPSVRIQLAGQTVAVGDSRLLRVGVELPGIPANGKMYRKEVFTGSMDEEIFKCAASVYHYKRTYLGLK